MSWREYRVTVPGKWVLAGEHTVLRGGKAIALPHPQFTLSLHYVPGAEPLRVVPEMASLPIQELLRRAAVREWPLGVLHLESTIPWGAGVGSSAALSVAVTRWLWSAFPWDPQGRSEEETLIDFARGLEDHFHGRSSGMDVSVVTLARPILFSMAEGGRVLSLDSLPRFGFHDTGMRASTRECVRKVEEFRLARPGPAERLDRQMREATELALHGLEAYPRAPVEGLRLIQRSMSLSTEIYREWGLIPEEIRPHLDRLTGSAMAARLTGAGGGGFIVTLENQ